MRNVVFLIGTLLLLIFGSSPVVGQTPSEGELDALLEQAKQLNSGDLGQMQGAQMQGLIQQLGPLQACLEDIDQQALVALQQESERLRTEVQSLCANGNNAEAQAKAEDYGRRIADSALLKKLADCTAGLSGLLPSMAALAQQAPQSGSDVCAAR